ncbi:hypothetical protein E4U42_003987 [Claviceps africana]|uniref:J domain-containing protein n=1 Tax=Claviceps africana TaxID=83212 RepID=A0A8K0J6J5_9HYPO|nr:hypothetical protein E4U42_003987 [Claviceps africana]
MGAQHSAPGFGDGATAGKKMCYYQVIGVAWNATDLEIKKAYRRKALELHPDRNLDDVHEATRKFAEIQAAYEILSDPQERAWYDSHRDAVLAGNDNSSTGPTLFRNVRLTSTEEILDLVGKFSHAKAFHDESTGFFGMAREVFEHLAMEEEVATEAADVACPQYPSFGFSADDYDTIVKPFYASWSGFSTRKSFSWKEKYRLSDAPDRRVRRLMEKENKKCREDAIRQFNEAVRFFITFVRRRDPRYIPNSQTPADRQISLRNAAASQAARSRTAYQQKIGSYEDPEWTRPQQDGTHEDDFSDIEVESDVEILKCVICKKSFKSIQQFEVHERSKKHHKAVQQLRSKMKKENMDLGLSPGPPPDTGYTETITLSLAEHIPVQRGSEDLNVDAMTRLEDRQSTADP